MPLDAPLRLLCTGDLHLGRYPSRLPTRHRALAVGSVWDAIVAYAVEQQVDAVLLTGDVVDRDNRFFEALGPLQRGLRTLGEAGIDTFAVSGNHDYDVFPQLVDTLSLERFRLLGRGGQWETAMLRRDGQDVLRLLGWSFPAQHVHTSPLDGLDLDASEVPTVGLLHGDADQRESRYAPLPLPALERQPVTAWLLGHIHRPGPLREQAPLVLYPGSPQPLDPGEEGERGPWLVEVPPQGPATARPLPLATVAYATLPVDAEDVDDEETFRQRVVTTMEQDLDARLARNGQLRRVVYRLRLGGRSPLHQHLPALSEQVRAEAEVHVGDAIASVDHVHVATRPPVDLEALAESNDPLGQLARDLLTLQASPDAADADAAAPRSAALEALTRQIRGDLEGIYEAKAYAPLRRDPATRDLPSAETIQALLVEQGLLLLDALRAQRDAATSA
ncbi:MAG: DNA repair exonuclease [Deinococcus-Thermus bacterium]|jgi:DNA repair exonuclease SbcCD nuclease subunit|nr:DNA repair exonuclease [Deinococcota bacterium]